MYIYTNIIEFLWGKNEKYNFFLWIETLYLEGFNIEQAPYDDEGIRALSFVADGDVRIAINGLQSAVAGIRILIIIISNLIENFLKFFCEFLEKNDIFHFEK